MLKQFKKYKVFIVIIVSIVMISLSVVIINNIIQRKHEMQFNKIVLENVNEIFEKMNFNVRDEVGTYFVEFKEIELKSNYKEIIKLNKGEAKVSYVFKDLELGTESEQFLIEIPITRENLNNQFSIENSNKYEEIQIRTHILEDFLEYKFDEFCSKLENENIEGETKIVSEVVYDYSELHYDRFGSIIDGSKIGFNAKKFNSLSGMIFRGEYTKSSDGQKYSVNMEIKEYAGELKLYGQLIMKMLKN